MLTQVHSSMKRLDYPVYSFIQKVIIMNVVVHCHAGVCRSGAVAEVGIAMGFQDTGVFRAPNLMVKHKLLNALGMTYAPE